MRFLANLLLLLLLIMLLAAWLMLLWSGAIALAALITAWLAFTRRGRQAASVASVGINTMRQRLGDSAQVGIAGVAIGFIGGLFPAARPARLPETTALREL